MQVVSPFLECSIAVTTKEEGPISKAAQLETLLKNTCILPIHDHSIGSYTVDGKLFPEDIHADILLSDKRNTILAHQFADCVPLLLVDRRKKGIVFAHAGWKGTLAGIVPVSILRSQLQHGSSIDDLWVWIGPCIQKNSYLVPMPPAQLAIPGWEDYITERQDGFLIDLPGFIVNQCTQLGIDETRIIVDGRDTFEESGLYSHRRYLKTQDASEDGNFAVCAWLTQ